jgi:hypothetical protein
MGYCTKDDVEAYYLNKTFDTGDYLNTTKANAFIASDYALINAAIRTRYTLPITDAEDLELLKLINAEMVVGTIDDIFREKSEDGTFDRGRNTRKEALGLLKQIKEGDMVLNSANKTSVIKFNTVRSDGEVVEPRFTDKNIDTE